MAMIRRLARRAARRTATVSGALALAVALSACGGGGGATTSSDRPSTRPGVAMVSPPADYLTITGHGFSISAPAEFQHRDLTSSNGEPMLVLEKPSSVEAIPERVAVIRDVDPEQSAAEQSSALESAKAAGGPEGVVARSEIELPEGSGPAFLITWKEALPASGSRTVQVTYWQLMDQVSEDLILDVVAFAPSTEFDASEVSEILRTFVADDTEGA